MNKLHPHIRIVWTLRWVVLGVGIGLVGVVVSTSFSLVVPRALVVALVVGVSLVGLGLAVLRYRSFRYEIRDDGIRLRRGVFTVRETFVPTENVQHIDVTRRLLERPFGLAHVRIHTAGVFDGRVTIPGLDSDRAVAVSKQLDQLASESAPV